MSSLVRNLIALQIALTFLACADDGVVGRDHQGGSWAGGGTGGGSSAQEELENCERRTELPQGPTELPGVNRNLALLVESARGEWANAAGEHLSIQIDRPATRYEFACYNQMPAANEPTTPQPPPEFAVRFELTGRATLVSDDGAWNESFPLALSLRNPPSGNQLLGASAVLDRHELQGSFQLPASVLEPGSDIRLSLGFAEEGWLLSRTVYRSPPSEDGGTCACGIPGPAWSEGNIAFIRR